MPSGHVAKLPILGASSNFDPTYGLDQRSDQDGRYDVEKPQLLPFKRTLNHGRTTQESQNFGPYNFRRVIDLEFWPPEICSPEFGRSHRFRV